MSASARVWSRGEGGRTTSGGTDEGGDVDVPTDLAGAGTLPSSAPKLSIAYGESGDRRLGMRLTDSSLSSFKSRKLYSSRSPDTCSLSLLAQYAAWCIHLQLHLELFILGKDVGVPCSHNAYDSFYSLSKSVNEGWMASHQVLSTRRVS